MDACWTSDVTVCVCVCVCVCHVLIKRISNISNFAIVSVLCIINNCEPSLIKSYRTIVTYMRRELAGLYFN